MGSWYHTCSHVSYMTCTVCCTYIIHCTFLIVTCKMYIVSDFIYSHKKLIHMYIADSLFEMADPNVHYACNPHINLHLKKYTIQIQCMYIPLCSYMHVYNMYLNFHLMYSYSYTVVWGVTIMQLLTFTCMYSTCDWIN